MSVTRPRCPSCPVGQAASDWPCPAPDCWRGIAGDSWEWTPETVDGRKLPAIRLVRGKVWPNRWGWERVPLGPEGGRE